MKKATEEKVDSVSKSNQLRKKIVTNKLTHIEVFMKVLSVLVVFMLFMSVEPVNAGTASLIAKGAKKLVKTVKPKKVTPSFSFKPAKLSSPAVHPSLSNNINGGAAGYAGRHLARNWNQQQCICNGTGMVTCMVCSGKGVVPGKLWGTNKCSSCAGSGKKKHKCINTARR